MFYNTVLIDSATKGDHNLFMQVLNLLMYFSDEIKAKKIKDCTFRCHTLCRLIGHHIPELKIVDGEHLGLKILNDLELRSGGLQPGSVFKLRTEMAAASHSWLVTPDEAIIDPYPVGYLSANAVLIPTKCKDYAAFGGSLYFANDSTTDHIMTPEFIKETENLIALFPLVESAA